MMIILPFQKILEFRLLKSLLSQNDCLIKFVILWIIWLKLIDLFQFSISGHIESGVFICVLINRALSSYCDIVTLIFTSNYLFHHNLQVFLVKISFLFCLLQSFPYAYPFFVLFLWFTRCVFTQTANLHSLTQYWAGFFTLTCI